MIAGGPNPNEFANGFDILADVVELIGFFLRDGSAVTGADRVDEDQIGRIKQGKFIINQLVRWADGFAFFGHQYPLGSNQSKVHPDGRRSWAAVEREGQRPVRLRVFLRIGDIKDTGFLFFAFFQILFLEDDRAGGDGVVNLLTV